MALDNMGRYALLYALPDPQTLLTTPFVQHYNSVMSQLADTYGPVQTPMWLASWELEIKEYPFDCSRPDSIPGRVYLNRSVDAPGGATLYWDLPNSPSRERWDRHASSTEIGLWYIRFLPLLNTFLHRSHNNEPTSRQHLIPL